MTKIEVKEYSDPLDVIIGKANSLQDLATIMQKMDHKLTTSKAYKDGWTDAMLAVVDEMKGLLEEYRKEATGE